MNKCQKPYCLKQCNPLVPGIYIGEPFVREGAALACHLCSMGFGAAYVYGGSLPKAEKPKLIKQVITKEEGL